MSTNIKDFKIRQISEEKNRKADAPANLAFAFDFISDMSILLEFFSNPSIEIAKTICQTEAGPTWMDGIIAYLRNRSLPSNKLQTRQIQYRSSRCCPIHGVDSILRF